VELDAEQFEKLCHIQCTQNEMSAWFKISVDTLERWSLRHYKEKLADTQKRFAAGGLASLRRAQWVAATEKDKTAMMIWLGKQYLGQTDKTELSTGDEKPFVLNYKL
jgi:hypothetical protein